MRWTLMLVVIALFCITYSKASAQNPNDPFHKCLVTLKYNSNKGLQFKLGPVNLPASQQALISQSIQTFNLETIIMLSQPPQKMIKHRKLLKPDSGKSISKNYQF